jgi:hypothetical protein
MEPLSASLSRWKVIFWRLRSFVPAAEGFLYLWPEVRRLLLLDRIGSAVAGHFLNRGEVISPGLEVDLPGHGVHVGDRDLLPPVGLKTARKLSVRFPEEKETKSQKRKRKRYFTEKE